MKNLKISIKDLHKAFGKKQILKGVNLDIEQGKSLVVIGGSGTGKSVLIKCIQGLLNPDSGSILIDGEETVHTDSHKRDDLHKKMGMLFQGGALFDSLTVWENVAFSLLQQRGMNKKKAKEKASIKEDPYLEKFKKFTFSSPFFKLSKEEKRSEVP